MVAGSGISLAGGVRRWEARSGESSHKTDRDLTLECHLQMNVKGEGVIMTEVGQGKRVRLWEGEGGRNRCLSIIL